VTVPLQRRDFLRRIGVLTGTVAGGARLAACAPANARCAVGHPGWAARDQQLWWMCQKSDNAW